LFSLSNFNLNVLRSWIILDKTSETLEINLKISFFRKWCAITSTAEDSPTSVKALTQGSTQNRRVEVLNKLFMKHITDLLSTGNCAAEVVGLGIEVTKVRNEEGRFPIPKQTYLPIFPLKFKTRNT